MKKRSAFLTACVILLLAALAGCAGVQRMTVGGPSMLPALADGAKVVVDKTAYSKAEPARGDVIAYKMGSGQVMIKRVIALPGETVEIRDKKVFVDGTELQEPYLNEQESTEAGKASSWDVEDRSVFVLGDNRTNSTDSRASGPVPYESIIGKVKN